MRSTTSSARMIRYVRSEITTSAMSPFQQYELDREAGTHPDDEAVVAGRGFVVLDQFIEDEHDGRRREVSDRLQRAPRTRQRTLWERQRAFEGLEHFGAAGVRDPVPDVRAVDALRRQERIHFVKDVGADELGEFRRQDDLETAVDYFPAENFLGIRENQRARRKDLGTGTGGLSIAAYQHRGCAVAEESGGDDIRDGKIFALQSERAQLDRQQHRDFRRVRADVIGGARSARGARDAAESEDRRALYFLAHAECADDASVDARNGDAGDGYEKQMVDVARLEAGALERELRRHGADFRCDAQPRVVGFCEGVERDVLLYRQSEMAPGDSQRALEFVEAAHIRPAPLPKLTQARGQLFLIDVIAG